MGGFKDTLKDALRQVAFQTSIDKLKKKGVQNVNVLGIDRIAGLVEAAVDRALKTRLMGVEREAVAETTKAEFLRLLRSNEDLKREKSDLERARERAEEEIDFMRRELTQKQSALKQRLEEDSVDQANRYVGEDAAIAAKVGEVLESIGGVGEQAASEELEERMIQLVMEVVSAERESAAGARKALQDREVGNLQRRIKKLNDTLESTERRLASATASKRVEPGISSIYREVQGLDESDAQAGRKKELIADIFRANLKLQKRSRGA